MTEKIIRKQGGRGKQKVITWHMHNKITGDDKQYFSVEQLADDLGVSFMTIYNIMRHKPVKNLATKQFYDSIIITKLNDTKRGYHNKIVSDIEIVS